MYFFCFLQNTNLYCHTFIKLTQMLTIEACNVANVVNVPTSLPT